MQAAKHLQERVFCILGGILGGDDWLFPEKEDEDVPDWPAGDIYSDINPNGAWKRNSDWLVDKYRKDRYGLVPTIPAVSPSLLPLWKVNTPPPFPGAERNWLDELIGDLFLKDKWEELRSRYFEQYGMPDNTTEPISHSYFDL